MKIRGIYWVLSFSLNHGPSEIAKKVSRGKHNGIVKNKKITCPELRVTG